jgi:hypothetical protein
MSVSSLNAAIRSSLESFAMVFLLVFRVVDRAA